MSSKKKFRKYTTATIAAAATMSAVAPIATTADITQGFSDVNDITVPTKSTQNAIYKLLSMDVIQGYPDGTFQPGAYVLRGQVAEMFTKAMDLEIPKNVGLVNAKYFDATSFYDKAKYIAATTEANLFKGQLSNEFDAWNTISRQQMASVLGKHLTKLGFESDGSVSVNLGNVSAVHREYVQLLADLGITKELRDFRAYEPVTRAQFSAFLVRTMDVIEGQDNDEEDEEDLVTDEVRDSINNAASIEEIKEILEGIGAFDGLTEEQIDEIVNRIWDVIKDGGSFDSNEDLEDEITPPSDEDEDGDDSDKDEDEDENGSDEDEDLSAEEAVEKAEESKSEEDYDAAKEAVDELPDGPEKDRLLERLENLLEIIQSAGPEATFKSESASLFTEPIVTELPAEQKTSGGLVGLNLGVLDLGLLSGNQISELANNENNIHEFTVDKDNERDVNVSVAVRTALGGKAYTLNVYKKTGEEELTRIDQYEGSGGGALGITETKEFNLGTFEEGEYTVLLGMAEGLTVVEVVTFKMYDVVNRDYSQVSTTDSIVTGNLLNNQQLGAKSDAIISEVQVRGQAETNEEINDEETEIKGAYGSLWIEQDGTYRYVPANDKENVGKTDVFEYTIKNMYNNKESTSAFQIKLVEVNTPR